MKGVFVAGYSLKALAQQNDYSKPGSGCDSVLADWNVKRVLSGRKVARTVDPQCIRRE
jgi:hypothetical protein